ncbi:hypothetical protein [Streptomyces sp. NPDC037389]|uniref:hypothetical protein n=1 Tax=Streptomyces sp. NPDC037389 TaxID=3155369 RepID=UPI0033D832DA
MSKRPGFPHRVTLDLTVEQFEAMTTAIDEAGGSMADYMRALIELHEQDQDLADRTAKKVRDMRAIRRETRRARLSGKLSAA